MVWWDRSGGTFSRDFSLHAGWAAFGANSACRREKWLAALDAPARCPARWASSKRLNPASPHHPRQSAPESSNASLRCFSLAPDDPLTEDQLMIHLAAKPETVKSLDEALNLLKAGEPVVLDRDGQPLAALISMEDLVLLQRLTEAEENRRDIEAADRVMAEIEAGRATLIPLEEAERLLDTIKD